MSSDPTTPHPRLGVPAVARMARVAEALGVELCNEVVFIGASLLPLHETETNVLSLARPTKDVDAVTAANSYTRKSKLEERLRARGFKNDMTGRHMDQWQAPDGTQFDLVSCGAHVGGTGNTDDEWVIANAFETSLPPRIRCASAVGLLLLKCGAYRDRGRGSPGASKDLADIAALVATRAELEAELRAAPKTIRATIIAELEKVLAAPRAVGAIRSHISDREPLIDGVADTVLGRMRAMMQGD
jgi:hypothetical protein